MLNNDQKKVDTPSANGLNATQKILIVGIVTIVVAVSVVGFLIYRSMQKEVPLAAGASTSYVVDESNFEEIKKQMEEEANATFDVLMNTEWAFPDPSQPSTNAYVANAEENKQPFFIEVKLNDTGDVVYTSSVLPPGNSFKEIVLDKQDLQSGVYPAVCMYNLLNEEGEIASSVGFTISINIG